MSSVNSAQGVSFFAEWSNEIEPHRARRAQLLKAHPEVRALFGYDRRTMVVAFLIVIAQMGLAWWVHVSSTFGSVLAIVVLSYFVGSILSHWSAMVIHETSHFLGARTIRANRAVALFANLPMLFPAAMSFHRYHIDHHAHLGSLGKDTDLPVAFEMRWIGNRAIRKFFWLLGYFGVYVMRALTFVRKPNRLEILNWVIQVLWTAGVFYFWGGRAVAYLALSTVWGHSLHPVAAHFIHEHYLFKARQETYSYYGLLNKVTFNVGYHNEHHDLMNIPGSRLPMLRKMAPEYYETLHSHRSWTWVLWHFISTPTLGVASRLARR